MTLVPGEGGFRAAAGGSETRGLAGDEAAALLAEIKAVSGRYRHATGKPLGVTGEVAELEAAAKLQLTLMPARTPGYDAVRLSDGARIQIKGRAVDAADRYRGTCPAIECGDLFDAAVLVLLDNRTLEVLEMWSAPEGAIAARAAGRRNRRLRDHGVLAITQFKSIAVRAWPPAPLPR